ncbi:MAG: serine/threonine-protein kinase [Actinomycetota bacterium]
MAMQAAAIEARKTPVDDNGWGFAEGAEIAPGRFVLKLLGGGRRYEAYLAHDEALLTTVVVKILRPHRVEDTASLEGLAAEYDALGKLNHPVIARGFDSVLEGGRPHIVIEFLEGPRLSSLIRRHGPLPMEQLVPLAVQLSSALHYMHGRDLVHLDVKPRNIIMGAPPRLIDLSIARSVEDAEALTVAVGTDAYMAPEQCDPLGPHRVGTPADVWGLGASLYEAATGGPPFPADDPSEYPQLTEEPAPMSDRIASQVTDLVLSCLRRDPAARPTPKELSEALDPLVAALPRRFVLNRLRPRLR